MTPRETAVLITAELERGRNRHRLALWTAWHTAALARQQELPELRGLLDRVSAEEDDEQDPDEQLARARVIAAAFSGLPAG